MVFFMNCSTPLKCIGMGKVVDKGELMETNGVKCISAKIEFQRRRNNGKEVISEIDNIWIKIFDSGADVFNDKANIDDMVFIDAECRIKRGLFEIKVNKFEVYNNENTCS